MSRCLIAAAPLSVMLLITSLPAQDDLRTLRARAIRQAALSVAASVVRVEKFGVAEVAGEVADDAPTVAIAVDDQRHFIASSLVQRQTPASIVLVAEDGRRSAAKVVATDHKRQLVLLEAAEDLGIKPVELASQETSVGQTVIAVGRIAGDGSIAVSSGVLSAKDRLWGIALQTDARVSSIFYGGPLIDLHGQLLGVLVPAVPDEVGEDVTAWYDAGVAFAIPADSLRQRLPTLLKGVDIRDGLLGVVAKSNDPYVESTEIAAVRPRSPAARADIQAADIVVSVAGIPVRSHREIKQILGSKDAGQEVAIELRRKDQAFTKTLTLADTIPPLRPQWAGVTATDEETAGDDGTSRIIITGIFSDAPAAALKIGDAVKAIDGAIVEDAESLRRRVFSADPDQPLRVTVTRTDVNGVTSDELVTIKTADVSGQVPASLPDSLIFSAAPPAKWNVNELVLPDIGNKAVLAAPEVDDEQPVDAPALGLLLLLADPGETDLKQVASHWLDMASEAGVIVCVVAPAKDQAWHPEEIDAAGRIVSSIMKRYPVDALMTAVGGTGPGPGGSMAMAAAIGRSGVFAGLAVQPDVSPPAIRLRENEPSAPLQLFLRGASQPDEPSWALALEKAGYAIVRDNDQDQTLLRWIRSLPRI